MVLDLKDFKVGDTIQNSRDKSVWVITISEPVTEYHLEITNLKTHETERYTAKPDDAIVIKHGEYGIDFSEIDTDTLEALILSDNDMETLKNIKNQIAVSKDSSLN
jgi:hypothetical protein